MPCQWVQDGNACIKALAGGEVKLLVSDLSLVEQDAISLLMSQPQYQHSGLPIVLLSAHDQTLIDGARRLLHDAGFNVLAALASRCCRCCCGCSRRSIWGRSVSAG